MRGADVRVLHYHFGKEGGAERFFVNLVRALGERGVEQRFVIRPGRIWRWEIEGLGEVTENHFRRLSISGMSLPWRVGRVVSEWKPNVIMAWKPRAARLLSDRSDAIRVVRLGDFPDHLRHFHHASVLVGNHPAIERHCQALGWVRPTRTIGNFPRRVEGPTVNREELSTPEGAFVVVGVGRFVRRKGMDLLIRAVAAIPNAWLWLIGDGEERQRLEGLAREVGVEERTRFVGWVEEPMRYIAASDVFGMPSRHEPFGNVILEAWRVGVPVVATRSEGPAWYMTDGQNGLVVDIDDLSGFTSGIQRLKDDRKLGERLVHGARTRMEELFDQDFIVDQYLDLFAGNLTGRAA